MKGVEKEWEEEETKGDKGTTKMGAARNEIRKKSFPAEMQGPFFNICTIKYA
jgi:hypothetical protein